MIEKRELKKLKIEACSVEHYKKLSIEMENKVMQLQCKIEGKRENVEVSTIRHQSGYGSLHSLGQIKHRHYNR